LDAYCLRTAACAIRDTATARTIRIRIAIEKRKPGSERGESSSMLLDETLETRAWSESALAVASIAWLVLFEIVLRTEWKVVIVE